MFWAAPPCGGAEQLACHAGVRARSREEVVTGFSESAEFRSDTAAPALRFSKEGLQQGFVDDVFRLYRATLDRAPDLGGLLGWTALLADGRPYAAVVSGFVNSPEFRATYGDTTDSAFVTLLYANVLDRAPDAAGLARWLGLLGTGARSREEVVQGFAQSPEFVAATARPLKDWMRGLGPDDLLDAGPGRNLLAGGLLSDTFLFRAGAASDNRVADFEPWDRLSFQGFGYASAAEVRHHMQQDGTDLVFADQGVTARFVQTSLAVMTDDVFLF